MLIAAGILVLAVCVVLVAVQAYHWLKSDMRSYGTIIVPRATKGVDPGRGVKFWNSLVAAASLMTQDIKLKALISQGRLVPVGEPPRPVSRSRH